MTIEEAREALERDPNLAIVIDLDEHRPSQEVADRIWREVAAAIYPEERSVFQRLFAAITGAFWIFMRVFLLVGFGPLVYYAIWRWLW